MKLAHMPWDGTVPPREAEMRARLEREGFEVSSWSDPAGRVYPPHQHSHDETLAGVRGRIVFTIDGVEYALGPGDRIILPGGTVHAAVVGDDGATYLIGQR